MSPCPKIGVIVALKPAQVSNVKTANRARTGRERITRTPSQMFRATWSLSKSLVVVDATAAFIVADIVADG